LAAGCFAFPAKTIMQDKKLIIVASVLSVLLIAGGWYYDQKFSGTENGEGKIITEDDYLGNPNAPVIMTAYSSYLCGYCIYFHQSAFPVLKEKYINTGKMKFVLKPYPPTQIAAAAFCAQEQGKFWEFSDYLYNHSREFSDFVPDLKKFAGNVGLNREQFDACVDSGKYNQRANKVFEEGKSLGVTGTPTFFINGKEKAGSFSAEEFSEIIEKELEK